MDADHSAPTALQNAETGAWGQTLDHALSTECYGTRFSEGVTYLQSEDGAWTTRTDGRLESRDTIIDNMSVIGRLVPGAEIKIGENNELLAKTPFQFSRYIFDGMKSLQDAFDLDGFFRTGDLIKRQGDNYVILDRSSLDSIRFAGYTMTTLSIETALYSLPYISQAIVLGIEDETYHQRVAAIISGKSSAQESVNLETLHKDLEATNLPKYKYPTVVYWLGKGEALPMSGNGKVLKKIVKERLFGVGYEELKQVEVTNLEMKDWDVEWGEGRRAWEWGPY